MNRVFAEGDGDWLTLKLADPKFRLGFDQERASREFQDQLQSVLDSQRITRKVLAERLGKSAPFVSQCLRRGKNLTIATMTELAAACGFELHLLLKQQTANGGPVFTEPAPNFSNCYEAWSKRHTITPVSPDVASWTEHYARSPPNDPAADSTSKNRKAGALSAPAGVWGLSRDVPREQHAILCS